MKKSAGSSILLNVHFLLITIIALGTVAVLSVINKPQTIAQYASSDMNLNTASEIEETINQDMTMGPLTNKENLSYSLPAGYLGQLKLMLRDSNFQNNSDLEFLRLTLRKAETRLIYLFLPGTKRGSVTEDNIILDGRKTNQHVNKWETIFPTEANGKITITMSGEKDVPISGSVLAGGKYSELRLYIEKAELKYKDQNIINLNFNNRSGVIRILRPFNIYAGEELHVWLDLNIQRSIVESGDEFYFNPVIINAVSK